MLGNYYYVRELTFKCKWLLTDVGVGLGLRGYVVAVVVVVVVVVVLF